MKSWILALSAVLFVLIPTEVHAQKGSLALSIGVSSWQDAISILSPQGQMTELLVSSIGASPSVSFVYAGSDTFALEASAGFLFGLGNAGNSSDSKALGFSYSARNVRIQGLITQVVGWRRLAQGSSSVGLGLPILIQSREWPNPQGGYSVSAKNDPVMGFFIAMRWRRSEWHLTPKLGFLNSVSRVYWSCDFGRFL